MFHHVNNMMKSDTSLKTDMFKACFLYCVSMYASHILCSSYFETQASKHDNCVLPLYCCASTSSSISLLLSHMVQFKYSWLGWIDSTRDPSLSRRAFSALLLAHKARSPPCVAVDATHMPYPAANVATCAALPCNVRVHLCSRCFASSSSCRLTSRDIFSSSRCFEASKYLRSRSHSSREQSRFLPKHQGS